MSSIAGKSLTSIFAVIFSFFIFANLAHAYATPGTETTTPPFVGATPSEEASWSGQSWSTISAPFASFLQSLQSAGQSVTAGNSGGTGTTMNIPAMPPSFGNAATEEVHDAFLQFDGWLAGIIGFHIATIVDVFLAVIAWTLGLAQVFVNWLIRSI